MKRFRVVRDYIKFPSGTYQKGDLLPPDLEVEKWLIAAGWVKESK